MALQPDSPSPPIEKEGEDARQGVISGRVITVLIVSMLLAIVAMVLAYAYVF